MENVVATAPTTSASEPVGRAGTRPANSEAGSGRETIAVITNATSMSAMMPTISVSSLP